MLRNNEEKMTQFASMVQNHEPVAYDVIDFLDGVSLCSECSSKTMEQNAMYDDYHSDTIVNNIIVYNADGKPIA